MRARMNYSRAERKTMVITALAIEIQHRRPGTLSAYAIAKKLGMTPGTHIHSILKEMVEDGELEAETRPNPGRWQTIFYSLPKGTYTPPPVRKRSVDIKTNGQLVGQLEMPL